MVRHDTHTYVIVVGCPGLGTGCTQTVALATHLHGGLNDGENLVDLVHVGLVLHDEGQPFQAGTRINRLFVQLTQERVVLAGSLTAHELVEHKVPDLEVTVAARIHGAAHSLGAVRGTTVVVPLGTGAGGAGLARIPEVLHARQAHNVLGIHANLLRQDVESLLVLIPNRHPETVSVEAILAFVTRTRQQIPCEVNSTFLEVVTEGEVTVHLEERTVASRLTHVVNVVGTNTLLHRRSPGPRRRLNAHDVGNEGNHARDREENRRLRGHQGDGRTDLMTLLLEVVEPTGADFRRTHSAPC